MPGLIGSEYLGDDYTQGREYDLVAGRCARHESLTNLSFPDESLKLIIHLDIMEHIPDYKLALQESFRPLARGGSTVFTCPFFTSRTSPLVCARVDVTDKIEHLEPPELHGNPLSKDGIVAWYHHGWGLLDELHEVGFIDVQLGCAYYVSSGFVSTNLPRGGYGLMLPIVIRARKE